MGVCGTFQTGRKDYLYFAKSIDFNHASMRQDAQFVTEWCFKGTCQIWCLNASTGGTCDKSDDQRRSVLKRAAEAVPVAPGSNVRWDGRYCLLNGFLETSATRLRVWQNPATSAVAALPITGGQPPAELHSFAATCGGVGVTEILWLVLRTWLIHVDPCWLWSPLTHFHCLIVGTGSLGGKNSKVLCETHWENFRNCGFLGSAKGQPKW